MILIDTHVWLWCVIDSPRLSDAARDAVDQNDEVAISPISCWEIATLVRKGRLELDQPTSLWVDKALTHGDYHVLPLEPAIAVRAGGFDR